MTGKRRRNMGVLHVGYDPSNSQWLPYLLVNLGPPLGTSSLLVLAQRKDGIINGLEKYIYLHFYYVPILE